MTVSICGDPEILIIEAGSEYAVALEPDAEALVVTVGEQGPPGPPGPPAATVRIYLADGVLARMRLDENGELPLSLRNGSMSGVPLLGVPHG